MVEIFRSLLGNLLPDWLVVLVAHLVTISIILVVTPVTFMMMVWVERRAVARMQDRLGPNRVGPAGLLQSVADGVKMFTKEDIVPQAADRWIHLLAPVIAAAPVMMIYAVLPWGRGLVPVNIESGVLFVVAVSSVSAVGLMMAGWGSNNKFSLLGAMRAVAQMVSYEIPAVLALLAVVIVTGTMSLATKPEMQAGIPIMGTTIPGLPDLGLGWFVFTPVGLVAFIMFFISALAEGERTPFDIPEADSEIIAGYMTEYSGMKFAVFYLGQFLLNYALAMLASIVFLGGWQGPGVAWLVSLGGVGEIAGVALSVLYLLVKAWFLFFVMIWLRGAFPRLRVDQLMAFAWKFLIPLALINLFSASLWVVVFQWGANPAWTVNLTIVGANLLGWLETAAPWLRQVTAIVVTGLINLAAFRWVLRINRPPVDETIIETVQDQVFGARPIP
jgi:NADH-quinone oxidoreductase subunit H